MLSINLMNKVINISNKSIKYQRIKANLSKEMMIIARIIRQYFSRKQQFKKETKLKITAKNHNNKKKKNSRKSSQT